MRCVCVQLGIVAAGLLCWSVGCKVPGKDSNPFAFSAPKIPAAPSYQGPALTSFDKESLLNDTGPVDADAPQEFSETNSGLKYRVLRKSGGPKPNAANTVTVNYRGWLDDGTEFDSSYKRGQPISFPLNGVIPGWTEGMQLVGQGGMIELEIPSSLGYGAQGAGSAVPPHATLHFIVELIAIQ